MSLTHLNRQHTNSSIDSLIPSYRKDKMAHPSMEHKSLYTGSRGIGSYPPKIKGISYVSGAMWEPVTDEFGTEIPNSFKFNIIVSSESPDFHGDCLIKGADDWRKLRRRHLTIHGDSSTKYSTDGVYFYVDTCIYYLIFSKLSDADSELRFPPSGNQLVPIIAKRHGIYHFDVQSNINLWNEYQSNLKVIEDALVNQFKYYFSHENLLKDSFLIAEMSRSGSSGWMKVVLFLKFNRIKTMTNDAHMVRFVLETKLSEVCCVDFKKFTYTEDQDLIEFAEDGIEETYFVRVNHWRDYVCPGT